MDEKAIDNLKESDALAISTALLYVLKGTPEYSVTSEMFYILDRENFIRMIKFFGGLTLKIPTAGQLRDMIRVVLLYQYYDVDKMSWRDAYDKSGFTRGEEYGAKIRYERFKELLKEYNIPRLD